MITITRADANRLLPQIVEEFGEDYRYPMRTRFADSLQAVSCLYVYDGKPDCIIGQLLSRIGADITFLGKCDEVGSIDLLVEQGLVDVEDGNLLEALKRLQAVQDGGDTWGRAYEEYQNTLVALV